MRSTDPDLARLAARVGRHLLDSRRGVATAESCTGGWIAKALTDIAGSSQWFTEGFVTYSNESKVLRLGVSRAMLRSDGAVSEATVRAMAAGGGGDRYRRSGRRGPRQAGWNRVARLGRAPRACNSCCCAAETLSR